MSKVRVIQFGFGSLGKEIFKEISKSKRYHISGIVDIDPKKAGIHPSQKKFPDLKIVDDIKQVNQKSDVVLHSTVSKIDLAKDQFADISRLNIPIISTCEELVYPYGRHKKIAAKIDSLAKKHRICILSVGVNPGFIMDSLVVMLSNLNTRINKITVIRKVDLTKRRTALQKKMLVGQKKNAFKDTSSFGHVGMMESANMICDYVGLKKNLLSFKIKPLLAERRMKFDGITIQRGDISGICHQVSLKDKINLKMRLDMAVGIKDYDYIYIHGSNDISFSTKVNGDKATVALLLNYIPIVQKTKPGLHTIGVNKLVPFAV